MSINERLQKAVSYAISAGYQLDKDAFEFLSLISKTEDPTRFMEEVVKQVEKMPEKTVFLGKEFLERVAKEVFPTVTDALEGTGLQVASTIVSEGKAAFKPLAKDIEPQIKVIEDPTKKVCATGSLEEYVNYFRSRFEQLSRLLRQRIDVRDAISIRQAFRAAPNTKLKIIGMISEKREVKNKILLRLEDPEAAATVLVPQNAGRGLMEKARMLLLDQVVCISAVKSRNNLFIANDIILPDIPQRAPRTAAEPVYAALISDMHVGSTTFLREEFNNFILWLNGKYGNARMREIASRVKYLIVAGDIVDGVGVYPNQLEELVIPDIYKQYELASDFFEQVPDYIDVIVVPGNHDASRKALPQPALPKDYAEPIYEKRKILSLGNPVTVTLHGVEFLIYHGRSLDDVVISTPNITFHDVDKAMRLLLQCRHLAPVYGNRTPIAPESRDFLVIERIPDVFHCGHVHVFKYEMYRGTLIVNSGAWQEQTKYQEKMGLKPTPGIVPVVDLQTLEVTPISFI